MDSDKRLHDSPDDTELPLPEEISGSSRRAKNQDHDKPAADLIRKRVEAAYANEPDVETESDDIDELGNSKKHSKHQRFIEELTNSGKSMAEIQAAWHEYYAGLPDKEKHQVWQEFYDTHTEASKLIHKPERHVALAEPATRRARRPSKPKRTAALKRPKLGRHTATGPVSHLQSLFFGLGVGFIVVLIFLFGFFNERFVAPFIQPSRNVTNTPIISDSTTVGADPKIIIPKINVEIPVVYGLGTIEEPAIQKALEGGVVHYADTAQPGENGNSVIVGHSSNNIFNKGKYKFAFVLLSRLETGDTFYLQKDGKRYTYQIYKKAIVKPTDVSVLAQDEKAATVTLITCDPPGTSTNRLVVVGEQISPDPGSNIASHTNNSLATSTAKIPGNSPSLWSRFVDWFAN